MKLFKNTNNNDLLLCDNGNFYEIINEYFEE